MAGHDLSIAAASDLPGCAAAEALGVLSFLSIDVTNATGQRIGTLCAASTDELHVGAVTLDELEDVLDLTDPKVLDALSIAPPDLVRTDHRFTREIGDAAHEHDFRAIRSASATGVDQVIAVFPDNLAGAVLQVEPIGEWTTQTHLTRTTPRKAGRSDPDPRDR